MEGGNKGEEEDAENGYEEGGKTDKGKIKDDAFDEKGDDLEPGYAIKVCVVSDLPYLLAAELVWPDKHTHVLISSQLAPRRVTDYVGTLKVTEGAVKVDATQMKTQD